MFRVKTPIFGTEITFQRAQTPLHRLLEDHFAPISMESVVITERRFTKRVRADLQRALDGFLGQEVVVTHFSGVRQGYSREDLSFADLMLRDTNHPALATSPEYEQINIGEKEPVRCLKNGFWLLGTKETKFAAPSTSIPNTVTRGRDSRSPRPTIPQAERSSGTSSSASKSPYGRGNRTGARSSRSKRTTGIRASRPASRSTSWATVERDQVILPAQDARTCWSGTWSGSSACEPGSNGLGLATKKGLLFYGPPGTGKTHTIHYLAGALPGHTTLLITAEQVGLLGRVHGAGPAAPAEHRGDRGRGPDRQGPHDDGQPVRGGPAEQAPQRDGRPAADSEILSSS